LGALQFRNTSAIRIREKKARRAILALTKKRNLNQKEIAQTGYPSVLAGLSFLLFIAALEVE
jgi:hypothetical protein